MSNQIDLNKFENDRHEFEQLKDANFTGKHITKRKFNNFSFLNCDFTGATISVCEFNEKCEFVNCNFTGTTFLNCSFNDTKILECNFTKTKFEDVIIDDSCNLIKNDWSNDCTVKNFKVRGATVEDINDLIASAEDSSAETIQEDVAVPVQEEQEEYDAVAAMSVYNALFPELLKQYPALTLETDENGNEVWKTVVDGVEMAVCADEEYNLWRVLFSIINPEAEFGGDYIGGSELMVGLPANKIRLANLKEMFESTVKSSADYVASQTNSTVVKNALTKIIQIVFGDATEAVIPTENTKGSIIVNTTTNPSVNSLLTTGWDTKNHKPVIIVGKPFMTNNIAEANTARQKVRQCGFIINEDVNNMSTQELFEFSKDHPYSCFVYEHSDMVDRVNIRTFDKNEIVIVK